MQMLDFKLVVNEAAFARQMAAYAAATGKTAEEALLEQARLLVQDLVTVTPPFHQGAGQGARVAKKAGDRSIANNLSRIFVEKDLKGSRTITHLFGRRDAPGLPYVVPTREIHPNVAAIYADAKRAARQRGRRGIRFGGDLRTVSRKKVETIYRREVRKVGWLAAGWMVAGRKLGAKAPAFVSRHSSPGGYRAVRTSRSLSVTIENRVGYGPRVGGMEKRMAFALKKRTDAMRLNIPRILRRNARLLAA